ncbi:UNVERIFIED_CONTAM: hypothetical protein O8I53_10325 [Campylobacter lari]
MMVFGDLAAPFFYALIQGFTEKYVVNFINKSIAFRNYKAQNMITTFELQEAKKANKESCENK